MSTIAIIDDHASILRILRIMLERQGHTTLIFESAQTALDTCDFGECDLAITDLNMDISGVEVIRALRQQEVPIPIIAMSGDSDAFREQLNGLDVKNVLTKPFTNDELIISVNRALGGAS